MIADLEIFRSRRLAALLIGCAVFLCIMALRLGGHLQALELAMYDRYTVLRGGAARGDDRIVLIEIRESDIQRYGHPLADSLLADTLEILLKAHPRVIGVDVYRDVPVPDGANAASGGDSPQPAYARLGDLVTGDDRIVMVSKFAPGGHEGIPAPAFMRGTRQLGFSDLQVDPGGAVRRGLLFLWDDEGQQVSLALRLALRFLRDEGVRLTRDPSDRNLVRIGETTIFPFRGNDGGYVHADDGGYQFLLDYRLDPQGLASYSLEQILSQKVSPRSLEDRIVILGTVASSVKDHFYTPLSVAAGQGRETYGIEIHAHAVNQLLRIARGQDRPTASLGEGWEALWILVWSLLGAGLGFSNRSAWRTSLLVLAGIGALGLGGLALFAADLWIPVAPAALAGVGSAGLVIAFTAARERAEREHVRRLFSRFVGPDVVAEIWRQRELLMEPDGTGRPTSRRMTLTTLMADMLGFTTATEKLDPYVFTSWINEFLSAMAELIEEHGGVVDDYAGDGIKANFGFPVPRVSEEQTAQDAKNAVRCAMAMGQRMERLNERWAANQLPTARLRIGIETGLAVVGVLGSRHSLKFTSLGDTINTASRLEHLGKDAFAADPNEACFRVLIGGSTRERIGDECVVIDLGPQELRGKQVPVRVYRVLEAAPREGSPAPEETEAR